MLYFHVQHCFPTRVEKNWKMSQEHNYDNCRFLCKHDLFCVTMATDHWLYQDVKKLNNNNTSSNKTNVLFECGEKVPTTTNTDWWQNGQLVSSAPSWLALKMQRNRANDRRLYAGHIHIQTEDNRKTEGKTNALRLVGIYIGGIYIHIFINSGQVYHAGK